MDIKKRVGRNLQHYRKNKGFSQEDLGFECNLHRTYISGIERGIRNPTVLIIANLAKALSIKPSQLLED